MNALFFFSGAHGVFPPSFFPRYVSTVCFGVSCSGSVFPSMWCVLSVCSVKSFFILNFRKIKVFLFVLFHCLGFSSLRLPIIYLLYLLVLLGSFSLYHRSFNISPFLSLSLKTLSCLFTVDFFSSLVFSEIVLIFFLSLPNFWIFLISVYIIYLYFVSFSWFILIYLRY